MRKGGSKSKGNSWEWQVARSLARWYYDDDEALIRMPTSGALATMMPTNREHLVGDVLQVKGDVPFPFAVEAKHHKDLPLIHLLFERKTSKLYKFWKLIKKEAKRADKIPMLVFKSNFQEALVVLPRYDTINGMLEHLDGYILTKTFIVIKFKEMLELSIWLDAIQPVRAAEKYDGDDPWDQKLDSVIRRANNGRRSIS